MPSNIYILSGLGADERVFRKLEFSGYAVTFIKWIQPHRNERIEHYAARLLAQIATPKPILMGLSFGGVMAVEIAKLIETEKVILLATAKTKNELPLYYRIAGYFGIHRFMPTRFLKSSNAIIYWFFGIESVSDKLLLKQILFDTDPLFLKWAISTIVHWRNQTIPMNTFHIHGSSDRILQNDLCNVIIL